MEKKQQDFQVVKLLGKGAFGEVHLVKNEMGMEFALKKIKLESEADIESAKNEAMFLFTLNHKNIVRFQQVFIDRSENGISILMEYASGGSLFDKVVAASEKGEQLSEEQILKWTGQVANALNYLHKNNIIHRDIKPQNVLLDSKGVLKLADMGISKVLENTVKNAKTFAGTKPYMSPEMLEEEPYDFKVDIWSLGVMLYQLLTYQLPFKKASDQLKGNYFPLPTSVSPIFHELIKRTLEADPKKRASANEVKKLIKEASIAKGGDPKNSSAAQELSEDMSTLKISHGTTVQDSKAPVGSQNASTAKADEDSSKFEKGLDSQLVKNGRAKYGPFHFDKFPDDGVPREFREWQALDEGEVYQGEWRTDTNVPHGRGILTIKSGDIFEGHFKYGEETFKGRMYGSNGDVYEGEMINEKIAGQIKVYYTDGSKYIGGWKETGPEGHGNQTWADGDNYEGNYKNGEKSGKGSFTYANGCSYVGDFEKDLYHGSGTYKFDNGDEYTGEWKDGKMHGKGTYTHANGAPKKGEWKEGERVKWLD